jgi:hypothetical protein
LRKIAVTLASLAGAALLTGVAMAGFAQSPVKTGTVNELSPAASTDWFAWTQSPADSPSRANVWAETMPVDGVGDFRVNEPGTRAWTGGIEGDQLVYQEIESGDSDIRLHNLTANLPLANEPINTDRWEWHPSISTDSNTDRWILFGRQNTSNWTQKIYAYNLDVPELRLLEEVANRQYSLIPGQINGDWVTWTACKPNCHVRRDNLNDSLPRKTIPRPSYVRHQYGSSISDDGVVYFVRSGAGCGEKVKLFRREAGSNQLLVDYRDNRDTFFTYVSDEVANDVYYDRVRCGSGAWDILKVTD